MIKQRRNFGAILSMIAVNFAMYIYIYIYIYIQVNKKFRKFEV